MRVAWFGSKTGPSESPAKGTPDGPPKHYPTGGPPGRGRDRAVLPRGRRLPTPQPEGGRVRGAQAALGLGGPGPRPLPAASRRGERALVPTRRGEVLRALVPRGGWAPPLLLPPPPAQAASLPGAVE